MTLLVVAEFGSAMLLNNENKEVQRRESSKRDHEDSNRKTWANLNAQIVHHSKSDKNLKWLDMQRVDQKWSKSAKNFLHKSGKNSSHKSGKNSSHKSSKNSSHKSGKNSSHKSGKNSSHKSGKNSSHKSGKNLLHKSGKNSSHKSGKNLLHKSAKDGHKWGKHGHKSGKNGQRRAERKAKWEALKQENQKLDAALKTTQESLKNAQNETVEWKAKYDGLIAKIADLEAAIKKLNSFITELKQKVEAGEAWKVALDKAILEVAELKKALEAANQRLHFFAELRKKFKRDRNGNRKEHSKSNRNQKSRKNSKSDKKFFQIIPTVTEDHKEFKLNDRSFDDKKSFLRVGATQ